LQCTIDDFLSFRKSEHYRTLVEGGSSVGHALRGLNRGRAAKAISTIKMAPRTASDKRILLNIKHENIVLMSNERSHGRVDDRFHCAEPAEKLAPAPLRSIELTVLCQIKNIAPIR